MAVVVDSSVFIEIERRELSLSILAQISADPDVALSAITASELLVGVHRADSPARRRKRQEFVEGILDLIPALAFDLADARVHARVRAELATAGLSIGLLDSLIAATARTHEYKLLTENVREFERMHDL